MSNVEQLSKLAQLLKDGLISQREFEAEKAKLMGNDSGKTSIGAYQIVGRIGRGGMGEVLRGRHRTPVKSQQQGGDVAIKLIHPHLAHDPQYRDRFDREASIGLELNHPGIVKVYDLIQDGDNLAMVMELVEGKPLSETIGQEVGPIPWEKASPMFFNILDAVGHAHAHKKGVVHRDIKPENIMVTANGIKVLDFGIAKDLSSSKTKTGTGMGTVDYMAPEQYTDAKAVDQRADIYALGMTLYEMLAGRLPWEKGATEFGILKIKDSGKLPPPTAFYPHIPQHVVQAVFTAVDRNLENRFGSTLEFKQALNGGMGSSKTKRSKKPSKTSKKPRQPKAHHTPHPSHTEKKENPFRVPFVLLIKVLILYAAYTQFYKKDDAVKQEEKAAASGEMDKKDGPSKDKAPKDEGKPTRQLKPSYSTSSDYKDRHRPPEKAMDENLSTYFCLYTNGSVTFHFDPKRTINYLKINNGAQKIKYGDAWGDRFKTNNRFKTISISTSSKDVQTVTLTDKKEKQKIELDLPKSTRFTLTLKSTYDSIFTRQGEPQKSQNCMSEIEFYGY